MAIDVSNLAKSLGINVASGTGPVGKSVAVNQGGKAAKPSTGFIGNVARSIGGIAGGALGGIAGGIAKGINDTGRGISQGLPGIGTQAVAQRNFNSRTRQFDIDKAQRTFTKQYRDGKISKERYNKLIKELGAEQSSINAELQGITKELVSPKDFAIGLATTATLPLAAGRLVAPSIAAKSTLLASTASRGAVGSAALAPVKSALMYQPSAKAAADIPGQVKKGEYGNAALNVATLASPLAIAGAAKVLPKVGKAASTAFYGKEAGPIKNFFGHKAIDSAVKNNPKLAQVLKQAEDFTKDQPAVKSGSKTAAEFFDGYLRNTLHLDPKKLTPEQFAENFLKYSKPSERLAKIAPGHVLTADYRKSVPTLVKDLKASNSDFSDPRNRVALANELVDKLDLNNPTAANKLKEAITAANSADEAAELVQAVKQLPSLKIKGFTPPKGFTVTFAPKNRANLTPLKNVEGDLDAGKNAAPILGSVGKLLENIGLSTKGQGAAPYAKYKTFLTDELEKIGRNASDDLNKITAYTREGRGGIGVFDERQLGNHALKQALGLSDSKQAAEVRKAILRAYDRMNLGDLGLSGVIENALYKLPGYGQYRRVQGAARYELNPLFRLQSGVEAEILSQAAAKGKRLHLPGTNNIVQKIFRSNSDELDAIADKIVTGRVKGILGEGYASEGVADTAVGAVSAKLTRTQKQSLGGLVKTLAEKGGYKNVDEFLENADAATLNSIRQVVQYPRDGFLSSNFAKTLNMAIFPSRYTLKIATLTGKALADMPPLMQVGTIKTISDMHSFLDSDEGIKWKADNSEILGIVNYLNPANNLSKLFNGLNRGDLKISDLGLIGGLPLGVITQILEHQGVTPKGNNPYLDPKTGEIVPDKIPANTQGAIKLAIIDLINSSYSFSGRTFGTDLSKSEITQSVPGLKLSKDDTKKRDEKPSAYQQRVQRVLSKPKSETPANQKAVGKRSVFTPATPQSLGLSSNSLGIVAKRAPKAPRQKKKARTPGLR